MGTPQVLTGVGQLETAAKGETSIELHPTLNCSICVTFLSNVQPGRPNCTRTRSSP